MRAGAPSEASRALAIVLGAALWSGALPGCADLPGRLGEGDGALFAAGTRLWSLTIGYSHDPDLGSVHLLQLSQSDYPVDDLAIHYGANVGYARARRTRDGAQGGPEAGLRWHFAGRRPWTGYVNGSTAVVYHQHPLIEDTLPFNFDVQIGVGTTVHLTERTLLAGGLGWHHLSNARIQGKERNLGYDGVRLSLGIMRDVSR